MSDKINNKRKKDTIVIIGVLALLAAIFYIYKKNKSAATTTGSITNTGTSATNGTSALVGSTNIAAPQRYADIKAAEVEGTANNYLGTAAGTSNTVYYDGGIMVADVPVETLPTGQKVQFVIYAPAYPNRLSRTNIYQTISSPNGKNGYAWYGLGSGTGAIYCSEVGSADIYPMSLDTARAIGMKQDIKDLLFVDDEYINQYNTPISAEFQNGWYSLSPVNPTVDPAHANLQTGQILG